MVSVLDSGASGPGCVVFLGKTLYSHSACDRPATVCVNGYRRT